MGLLTVHKENFVSVVENFEDDPIVKYADVFDKRPGKLPGKVHLQVDPACQPGFSSQESARLRQREIQSGTSKVAGSRGHCSRR